MKVSKHFTRSEFACHCGCKFDAVDIELIVVGEDVREHFKSPVTITSGCRCHAHNISVLGAKDSQHGKVKAADIKVNGVPPDVVHAYLCNKYHDRYGIGGYDSFTHIDVRENRARW
jgi:uncharacterized protein YcbK (DUF882 family)